jgi:DNA-binding transcriptional LysR family regulator
MNISHLYEFLSLARHLNFTAAAHERFLSQPALSRHLSILEEELGTRLLERDRHNVRLTPAGEMAARSFEDIIHNYEQLLADLNSLEHDETINLRLGMVYYGVTVFYGYPLLRIFAQRYPDTHVSTVSAQSQRIYQSLRDRSIDIALVTTSRMYNLDEIKRVVINTLPLYAMVAKNSELATFDSLPLEELALRPIILNRINNSSRHYIELLFAYHNLALKDIRYIDHIDDMPLAIEETGGYFLGSRLLSVAPWDLRMIPLQAEDFTVDVAMLYHEDNSNPNIAKFAQCVAEFQAKKESNLPF